MAEGFDMPAGNLKSTPCLRDLRDDSDDDDKTR